MVLLTQMTIIIVSVALSLATARLLVAGVLSLVSGRRP
jgi:hypothetical protein